MRGLNRLDKGVLAFDQVMRTVFSRTHLARRDNPADSLPASALTDAERKHSAGLMRINHAGEVCAQALYQGQALTAKLPKVRVQMQQAADEEIDHLAWCQSRLTELNSHTSFLNPLWYGASFSIGAIAGLVGDRWSLGFVAETERQVVVHLDKHMHHLSHKDQKSLAILKQMQIDEASHQKMAEDAGAALFSKPMQTLMTLTSKVMTTSAYRL